MVFTTNHGEKPIAPKLLEINEIYNKVKRINPNSNSTANWPGINIFSQQAFGYKNLYTI